MVVSVSSRLWHSIYYPIRDHFMDGITDFAIEDANGKVAWLEGRFAEMGIRLFNDGTANAVWTHAEIPDELVLELVLKWA